MSRSPTERPCAGIEAGGVEGGALEQDDRHAEMRGRAARHLRLPQAPGCGRARRRGGRPPGCARPAPAASCPSSRNARLPSNCSARAAAISAGQSQPLADAGSRSASTRSRAGAHAAARQSSSTRAMPRLGVGIVDRRRRTGLDQAGQRLEAGRAERDIIGRGLGQPHEDLGLADRARILPAGRSAGKRISAGFALSPMPAIAAALGRRWRMTPFGVPSSRGPKRSAATSPSITRIAPFFRLIARGKGVEAAVGKIEQGELVAHQAASRARRAAPTGWISRRRIRRS